MKEIVYISERGYSLSLFVALANADTWEQIDDFVLWNQDYLRQYIELKNGVPYRSTI